MNLLEINQVYIGIRLFLHTIYVCIYIYIHVSVLVYADLPGRVQYRQIRVHKVIVSGSLDSLMASTLDSGWQIMWVRILLQMQYFHLPPTTIHTI